MLVGSKAWEYWSIVNTDTGRKNSDWDIITDDPDLFPSVWQDCRIETSSINDLNNQEMYDNYASTKMVIIDDVEVQVCSMKGLSIMKRSHLHRPWFFQKHICMYHNWKFINTSLADFVSNLKEQDSIILQNRIELTKAKYGDKTPSLNQSNKDFFDDSVTKIFIHDDIHELMAHDDRPMYERMKKPETMDHAWCSEDGWNQLDHDQQVKCVLEECYVISLERFIIPLKMGLINSDKSFVPKVYFLMALEKVCTTLCSGYFRDFALNNWREIHESFDEQKLMGFFNTSLWLEYDLNVNPTKENFK